jgi:periplasmic divalent cation tolerance protein
MQHEAEVLLIIKTAAAQCDRLRASLDEIHPYEVPEFIAIEPRCHQPYLEWLIAESG